LNKIANKKEVLASITKVMAFIENAIRNIGNAYFETIAAANKRNPITKNRLYKFFMPCSFPSRHIHSLLVYDTTVMRQKQVLCRGEFHFGAEHLDIQHLGARQTLPYNYLPL